MNMNMEDIYYNKYIKYKTKYLELKEQSGTGFFYSSNEEIYGPNYEQLNKCIILTEVIKEIINIIEIEFIKKIIKREDRTQVLQTIVDEEIKEIKEIINNNIKEKEEVQKNNIKKLEKIKKIIINSKIDKLSKKENKHLSNIRLNNIVSVLNNIEEVLFDSLFNNTILPKIYEIFKEKFEAVEIKIKMIKNPESTKTKKLEAKKATYDKNMNMITTVYNTFCIVMQDYYNYYNSYYDNIIIKNYEDYYNSEKVEEKSKKTDIIIKNTENKNILIKSLNDIQPKVPLLIKTIELYFYFLNFYIENDIKPHSTFIKNITTKPFEVKPCSHNQNSH
jgi:hypothetical protein